MGHRRRRSGGWFPRVGGACLATVLATAMLVASNSRPAQAAGTTMVSLAFTGATQDQGTTPSLSAPPSVPPSTSESGFPCLTAGTDPQHAPIPGCGLSTPDPAGQGALRFNSDTSHGADGLTIGSTLPTAGGLVITFDMYQYGPGTPGDGMALALSTASPTRLGPAGGDLGYATQACCDGMADAYLGVGFDVFGNYTAPGDAGSGCGANAGSGFSANTVTVRGSGNAQVGYCQLSTSGALAFPLNAGDVSRSAAVRSVQFTLLPSGSYTVAMDPSGGTNYATVTNGSLPATYFDAATGASVAGVPARVSLVFIGSGAVDTEFQEISNLTVSTVTGSAPVLSLTETDSTTGSIAPGASFSYTMTPRVAGSVAEADPASLEVTDPLSAALTVVGTPAGTDWDCSGSTASNVSCGYSGGPASIPAGMTLNPITVSVTASDSVAAGELMNFASLVSDDAEWPVEASATVLVSGALGPPLATWTQQHPATSPPGRDFASSTFDPAIGATVLFGGTGSSSSDLGDTWTYDGATWAQSQPTTSPSARHGALMAFDPDIGSKGLVVLFGGQQSNGDVANDTWTYDGTTWTELSPAVSPPARVYGSMAFDPAIGTDGEIVLFGGEDQGGGAFGDTWTFDGTHWSQLTPATSPSARVFGSMAFDAVTAKMVLFAGADSSDTWSFDGTNWTDVTGATRPPPRLTSSMAFDPAIGSLVMFGGAFNSLDLGDTWSYDGTTWAQQSPAVSPPARSFSTMALDSAGDLVVFGGQLAGGAIAGDTWTFGPVPGVTAGPPTVAATVGDVALGAIPPAALVPSLASVLGSSLKAASAFHDSPFSVSPFSVSPFSVSPFSVSPFSVSPLVDPSLPPITLNEIPLTAPESWAAELAGTPLAALPVQSVTLQQVLALPHPPAVTLGQFDLSGTPLANLSVEAFLLGTTPVASLGNVCPTVATEAVACSQLSPASHSAIDFELAGDNLNAFYTNPPLALTALSHLVDSPLTTSLIGDWAFDQSPVGGIATSTLPASIVSCPPSPAPGTCDTLADAEQHQFVTAGATGGQLLALPASVIGGFNLADLIPAILPSQDLPVNSLSLAAIQALLPVPAPNTPGLVTFNVSAQATCQGLTLVPHLPPGFALIPGSAQVAIDGGALQPADVDTTTGAITPGPMSPCIGDNSGNAANVAASFQARPGATLGPVSVTVTVTASGFTQTVSATPATVTDGQDQAPNTAPPPSPTVLPNDTLMLENIAAPGHTDFFGLPPAEAGATVTVTLSHIPAGQDYDLALFGPPGPLLQPDDDTANSPFKNSPYGSTPVGDDTAAVGAVNSQTPTVTEADVPQIPGKVLRAVSAQRGNTDESFQFVAGAGDNGPFVVQVSGYNGSSSPQPYVIQAHVVNPLAPLNCQARSYNGGGTVTSLPAMPLPATTQALILVDGKRTGDIYGTAGETAVLAAAQKLAATPVAGQSAAMGTVIPVDGDPAVAAAYQGWDAANCDSSTANAVVAAINALVDRYRVGLKDLRYIVVVGSDEVIPFARIPDLSALGNEEGFDGASFNGLANATSAALSEGYMLSDDAYGDFTPSPWFNASLYVPQVAVGRLVETPADITAAVNAYVTLGGRFNPSSSLTTGYDFMTPAADLVNSALATQVPPGKATLVAPPADPTWSRSDLVTGNSTAQIPPLSSVANGFLSLNAHYDQYQAESAQAFQGTTPDTPITPADLPSNLTNAVLFTMGCHAGLNLADVLVANPTAAQATALGDWAQNVSQRGGLFAGNTGFGEGDSETVAYSERLIAYFAQNLNGQMTIGQALMFAKQHYLDVGAPSVYDAKALEEMVFYGLPMYALGPSGGAAPSVAPQVPPPPPPPSSPPEHAVTPVTFAAGAATQLVSHTDGSGHSYFTVNSQFPQVTPYEPVLPRTEIPLPPSTDGETPHGALIEQLTSTDQSGIKPLVDTPVIDENATTVSPAVTEADYPSVLASIDHTLTPAGPLDTLVVVPAQFSQNLERTFSTIDVSVESSNSDDDDPPVIGTVNAGIQGTSVGFTVTTPSVDVTRGVVLFLAKSGSPTGDTWTHVELTNGGNGRWTGGATVPASLANKPIGQYFVQLVDSAGNVATSSNKALNFIAPVLPVSAGIHIMANNAAVAATPYTGPVTISLQDNTGGTGNGAFQLAVDGGPATAYTAPVTLTADGVHMIDATNTADGSHTDTFVTISTQSPTITVTSPADGGQYPLGAVITASFDCASLVGIQAKGCIQTSPAPGAALSNTLGSHTVTFQATDSLGRVTTRTVTYAVVAVSPALSTTTIKASPAKPALDKPVKFTATGAASGGAANGPGPTGTVSFYLDGQSRVFATATLVSGSASVSTSGLGAGSHLMSATYSGDANFGPSSSATAATISVTCATTITGNHSGSVALGTGTNCVVGATLGAAITVPKGAVLDLEGSTVTGSIVVTSPGSLRVCGSTIGGSVTVTKATGAVLFGDAADFCAPNRVTGGLTLIGNTAGVQAIGNRVSGGVTASGNRGAGPFPGDTAPVIADNGP